MTQSKAESFSAFLEARQKSKSRGIPSTGTPLSLLNTLADADQEQMAVKDLMPASGMALIAFADALKSLQDSGYVTVSGQPGEEAAHLTALGRDVSRLSRTP